MPLPQIVATPDPSGPQLVVTGTLGGLAQIESALTWANHTFGRLWPLCLSPKSLVTCLFATPQTRRPSSFACNARRILRVGSENRGREPKHTLNLPFVIGFLV